VGGYRIVSSRTVKRALRGGGLFYAAHGVTDIHKGLNPKLAGWEVLPWSQPLGVLNSSVSNVKSMFGVQPIFR
jgi:hypothetical protein